MKPLRPALLLIASALLALPAASQSACEFSDPSCAPPRIAREFRGVWIASVDNIDWPSRPGLAPDVAKRELIALLDHARRSGLNAVILQVRPAGDALYSSDLEPWSEYLTGRQGVPPKPWWDPLKFAVDEAHRRGLELHAWFNPYRARHSSSNGKVSRSHIATRRPGLVKSYGKQAWMDPGEPAVRAHTVKVILDVVKRYDIDGVHIDDYFYPYKERDRRGNLIEFPDAASYGRYRTAGGILAREDWRRENVDKLVEELYHGIRATKPWVKFGISPFGIWRPGYPAEVVGFDAYAELYADARKWLREGWVDYLAPQLYWPLSAPEQSYTALLRWWAEQNSYGRHLWPGNFASKVAERSRTAWRAAEIVDQVAVTRAEAGASGNIHFSAKVFAENRDSLASRLAEQVYSQPAIVPPSPWMAVPPAGEPTVSVKRAANGAYTASVTPAAGDVPRWWLVQTRTKDGDWSSTLVRGSTRTFVLSRTWDRVAVRPVDRAAIEGPMHVIKLNEN